MGWLSGIFGSISDAGSDLWGEIRDAAPQVEDIARKGGKVFDDAAHLQAGVMTGMALPGVGDSSNKWTREGMKLGTDIDKAAAAVGGSMLGAQALGFGGPAPGASAGPALGSADKAALFGNAGYGQGMTGAETSAFDSGLGFDFGKFGSQLQDFGRITQAAGGQQQERPMPRPVDTSAQQAIIQQMIQQLQQRGGR
jgi:hypothetical protein